MGPLSKPQAFNILQNILNHDVQFGEHIKLLILLRKRGKLPLFAYGDLEKLSTTTVGGCSAASNLNCYKVTLTSIVGALGCVTPCGLGCCG